MNKTTATSPCTVNAGECKEMKTKCSRPLNPAPGSWNALLALLHRFSILLDKSLPVDWKASQVTVTWRISLFSLKLEGLHSWSLSRPNCNLKAGLWAVTQYYTLWKIRPFPSQIGHPNLWMCLMFIPLSLTSLRNKNNHVPPCFTWLL